MKHSGSGREGVYKSIFENVLGGIYLVTPDEEFITINSALSDIFGYESTSDLMKDISGRGHQLYVKPDRREKFLRMLRNRDSVRDFESQAYRKDKSVIWISESVSAVRNGSGKLLYYVGNVEDITTRKQAEESLRHSEAGLRMWLRKSKEDMEVYAEMLDEVCDSYNKLDEIFLDFIEVIVRVMDERCTWMKGHSERVAAYAIAIATAIGLQEEELRDLRIAALLHDIGRLCSHDDLFEKRSGLSAEEYELIKRHPVQGASILDRISDLKGIIPFIKYHHERIDGKGYPDGLKGEEIPLCARIIHLAESFDSMTVDRPYRPAPGKEFAFAELRRCNNTQFDPRITEVALRVL